MVRLKTISGFPNYAVSKNGKVWSRKRQIFLKPQMRGGYKSVRLHENNKWRYKTIHRLLLRTFIGKCPKGMEACHNNGNRSDNRLENLRWDTRKHNHADAIKHGTHTCLTQKGENSSQAKLTEQDVRMIVYMCRTGDFSQREIADIYHVRDSCISRIVNKKRWKHIWRN